MKIEQIKALYNEVANNWQALDRNVSHIHGEAEDNAIATLKENGEAVYACEISSVYSEDFYIHYLGSLETILACCDFVTEAGREFFEKAGVKY